MSGRVVILSGPSGVGKDTVIDAWRARDPRVRRVVAATTRDPRPGEVDGVDYHFLSDEEFLAMEKAGEFLESKLVHGRRYGTPLAGMRDLDAQGCIAILKIDVQGAIEAMTKLPDALSVMIVPPSWEELERRIRSRGTEGEDALRSRLDTAKAELAEAHRYSHRVVNDDVGRCVEELASIAAVTEGGPAKPRSSRSD